jgi:Domain of unknown function (DUF4349)
MITSTTTTGVGVRRAATLSTLVTVGALALVGCSSSAGTSSAGASASSSAKGAVAAVAGSTQPFDGASAPAAADGSATEALGSSLVLTTDRSIVVRADLSVRVDDVGASTARLGALASAHRATIASQATSDGIAPVPVEANADGSTQPCAPNGCPSGYASSTTTLRVANADVDALLRDVRTLGTVESSSRTTDDVTADVADVGARVSTARASLDRVRALMARASTLGEVVALEGELSKRQADLEALEARQRALADQSAQATVTVTLLSSSAPVPATESSTGFLAGLQRGWQAFTVALTVALTVLGAVVPFALVLVPVLLVVWVLLRRRREAQGAPTS